MEIDENVNIQEKEYWREIKNVICNHFKLSSKDHQGNWQPSPDLV